MRIAELPEFQNRSQVLTCGPNQTALEAVVNMAHKHYGAIAVTEKDKLLGIFTERDLLTRVVGQGRDVETTKIRDVMSTKVETATPSDSVNLCMGRMNHGRFRHMPVVDENHKLIGMLSQRDFIAHIMREMSQKKTA